MLEAVDQSNYASAGLPPLTFMGSSFFPTCPSCLLHLSEWQELHFWKSISAEPEPDLQFQASNAPVDDYSTASIGSGQDQVYGLIQCTGYTPRNACQACATNMATQITQLCPNQKQGSIYNKKCTLQYSDRSFFSDLDSTPRFIIWNNVNAPNPVLLGTNLEALLKSL
ncbi:unnamed protein product [Linum tenue]|uniref:Gnk2-homologous domain-containing protein n=1 Tax=Linum tenue TaxID=586396 RepID=A0AAV0R1N7_9ROSI|nr:unnamed protein product [Linum tenue]